MIASSQRRTTTGTTTDQAPEWETERLDLDAYLTRVWLHVRGPADPAWPAHMSTHPDARDDHCDISRDEVMDALTTTFEIILHPKEAAQLRPVLDRHTPSPVETR